jgi:hypothetical protein
MSNQALAKQDSNPANLQLVNKRVNQLIQVSTEDVMEIAKIFADSGAFEDSKQAAKAAVKIIAGAELGFTPIVSMANIHFFKGKAVLSANAMASLIKDSGKYEYKILQHDETICEIAFYQWINNELKSLGTPVRYTIEEARHAGLSGKDNWKYYPKDMLFAACIRQGMRRYCADLLRNVAGVPSEQDAADEALPIPVTDTQEMDNQVAQNVTVDAESYEAVDLSTGEVIEGEPLDNTTENLRAQVQELFSALPAARQKDLIAGKPFISKMTFEELTDLKVELDKTSA